MIEYNVRPSFRQRLVLANPFTSPAFIAAFGVLFITVIALFTAPYIGMADNGDFFRITYSNGLYFNQPDYDSQYFGYFIKQFGIFQYYNENQAILNSSQSLFIKLAIGLNKLLYSDKVFDVRFQAAMYTILYVCAIYILIESITWKMSRKQGLLIAAIAIFIFGDTAYTAFFNSFFGESVVTIMMIFVFGSWLALYRKRYNDYAMLALLVTSTVILTTSKQQNAPVGMIISVLAITLIWIRRDTLFRWLTMGSVILMMFTGVATYLNISKEFVDINQYHAMTRGVLNQSSNPEDTLKSFGIDEQFAILKGTIYYEQYGTIDVKSPILEKEFYSRYGFVPILKYYASNPGPLNAILNVAAKSAFTIRPPAMGNYEKSAGKEYGSHTRFFSGYSLLKEKLAPRTFGFVVIWVLLILALYMPSCIAAVKEGNLRGIQRMALILATMGVGVSGILVSIIGAGDADLSKHEFLFTLSFDLVTFLAVSNVIGRFIFKDVQRNTTGGYNPEVQKDVGA
ncbi:hypothetical protein [Paenibacillus sp. NPDC057934]|uniref:glycan biosynthesis hexose transferase WsfD n=1 Tax=Paenibacillus sp. NPDC057934 TaxID=3346282 RepID=UPI0036DC4CAA